MYRTDKAERKHKTTVVALGLGVMGTSIVSLKFFLTFSNFLQLLFITFLKFKKNCQSTV